MLLAVHNRRSGICDRCFFVQSNDALGNGILRSSTSHTFDNFIEFGCEDEDKLKLISFEGNIFVTDSTLDTFSWHLIPCNQRIVATSLSTIVESVLLSF